MKGVYASLDESQPGKKRSLSSWFRNKIGLERNALEIQQVIDESEERGLIDPDEGEMIEGIVDLKDTVAREIMIPRTQIIALPKDSTLEEILTAIIQSGHSRLPVYEQNVDHIVGIINAKDLLPLWLAHSPEFLVEKIVREPFFVPETKLVRDLLNELRDKKSHLAVIVDEYGGTAGIVTIEDIVEEIIGEIRDEYDREEEAFVPQDDGTVMVHATANLDDVEERFGVSLPRGAFDTLGGYIINFLGRVPRKGEEIMSQGLKMHIVGGDPKRITRVVVSVASTTEEQDAANASV
jgi:CBS domain containing-hemolysin-like protein